LRGARDRNHYGGHSLADVAAIVDVHYLGRTTKLAVSAAAKLGRGAAVMRTDDEQKLQNMAQNGNPLSVGKRKLLSDFNRDTRTRTLDPLIKSQYLSL